MSRRLQCDSSLARMGCRGVQVILATVLALACLTVSTANKAETPPNANTPNQTNLTPAERIPDPTQFPEYKNLTPTWLKCAQLTGVAMRLEALPGVGVDILSDTKLGAIVDHSYDNCEVTQDGMYLVSDSVSVEAIKTSKIDQAARMFKDFNEYTSTTSQSFSFDFSIFPVFSSSFSESYQSNKRSTVTDQSTTMRMEARQELYKVQVKVGAPLTAPLKARLTMIAEMLHSNMDKQACYEYDLIIRDFGTTGVRSVTVGGVFTRETMLKTDFVTKYEASASQAGGKLSLKAMLGEDFLLSLGMQSSYGTGTSNVNNYGSSVTQSHSRTYGGPAYREGLTLTEWQEQLSNSVAAIDHVGDPIEYFISPESLPDIPEPTVRKMASGVAAASKRYVKYNTHEGCTDPSKENFNYRANAGEASLCLDAPNNYAFSGTFQNCSSDKQYDRDVCAAFVQKNPLAGGFACPSDSEAVHLHTGSHVVTWTAQQCQEEHHHCGLFGWGRCTANVCHMQTFSATVTYQVYWCVNIGKVRPQSGYMFGGIYSPSRPNQLTGNVGCAKFFMALRLGAEAFICVSDDYDQGLQYAIPFGGLFSCTAGNPLVLKNATNGTASNLAELTSASTAAQETYPRNCPHPYARHLAVEDDGCEIEYCVKANAFRDPVRTRLHRPPYGKPYPSLGNNTAITLTVSTSGGAMWTKNVTTGSWVKDTSLAANMSSLLAANRSQKGTVEFSASPPPAYGTSQTGNTPMSSSHLNTLYTIIAVLTVSLVVVLVVLVWAVRKHRQVKDNGPVSRRSVQTAEPSTYQTM